jgi:hypothetical protein
MPIRFSNSVADGDVSYLQTCRILTEMADAFFSSSWRILEPYGRAQLRSRAWLLATECLWSHSALGYQAPANYAAVCTHR